MAETYCFGALTYRRFGISFVMARSRQSAAQNCQIRTFSQRWLRAGSSPDRGDRPRRDRAVDLGCADARFR